MRRWKRRTRWLPSAFFFAVCAAPATLAQSNTVSFARDIAPILARKCITCHGPEKAKGNYRVDSFALLTKTGGSKSAPITPGQPQAGELWRRLTATDADDRMPQKDDPLPAPQLALIERWLREGATFDGPDKTLPLNSFIQRVPHAAAPAAYPQPIPLTALALSSEGKLIAASGYHEVTLWNSGDLKLSCRIGGLPERIRALAWQPHGELLAVAGGSPGLAGEVSLVRLGQAGPPRLLASSPDMMLAVNFSPDGHRLAAGGSDNSIHVFDVESGREELLIQQHADWIVSVAFSPDKARLASASRDRTARVFDSKTGELETTFADHAAPVLAIAWLEDGKRIATAGRDKKIQFWNAKDGKKSGESIAVEDEILQLVVAGPRLVTAGADRIIRLYNLQDRSLVRAFAPHDDIVYSLAFDPGSGRLLSGSHDGELRVWNSNSGELLKKIFASPGLSPQ